MTCEQLYKLLSELPSAYRMLCIDALAVGCYLVDKGQRKAGLKLMHTALATAGLNADWANFIVKNRPESLAALAMHAELKGLFAGKTFFSGDPIGKP